MMRNRIHIILCVAALSVSPLGAGDNEPRRFGGRAPGGGAGGGAAAVAGGSSSTSDRGSVPRLAGLTVVQKELGLSAEQKNGVKAILEQLRESETKYVRETHQAQRQSRGPELGLKRAEADKQLAGARDQARRQIVSLLTPAQATRMEQLCLQDAGAEALFWPDTVRGLGLSQEQQRRLAEIRDQAKEEAAGALGLPKPGTITRVPQGGTPRSVAEIIRRSHRRMLEEVLTAAQQAKLKDLQGAPFAIVPGYRLATTINQTDSGSGGGRSGGPGSAGGDARPQFEGETVTRAPGAGGGAGVWDYYPLGGRGSVPRLASLAAVKKELGLTAEQQDAVKAIIERLRESESKVVWETRQAQLQTPGPQKAAKWAEADEQLARAREPARQQIVGLLTPAQAKRLEQISLQDSGATASFRPEIIQTLGISPEQQQRLAQIRDKAKEEIAALHRPARNGTSTQPRTDASPPSAREIVEASERRMVEEVLTAGQQARLREMQGAPFALPPNYRPPMGLGWSGGGGGSSGGRIR